MRRNPKVFGEQFISKLLHLALRETYSELLVDNSKFECFFYNLLQRNSFQVAIATDGISTFAVFNYKDIVWDGGMASGGHPDTGIGANNPPAQVIIE